MATIKVKFRPSTIDGKEGTILYKIIHKRVASQVSNNHKFFPSEWDNRNGKVIIKSDITDDRKIYLAHLQGQILSDVSTIADFTPSLVMVYECYLKDKVCSNSSSCYMRNLHAIYNKAVHVCR